MTNHVALLALLLAFVANIYSIASEDWLVLNLLSPPEGASADMFSTVGVGIWSAHCESNHNVGCRCRPGTLFQRSPPEPPTFDKGDTYNCSVYLRSFWEEDRFPLVGREDTGRLEEATRQHIPRWNSTLAENQLAALKMLRSGGVSKDILCCLAFSIFWLFCGLLSDSAAEDASVLCILVPTFLLTASAILVWHGYGTPETLAAAFGGYDDGSPGPGLIAAYTSAAVQFIALCSVIVSQHVCPAVPSCGTFRAAPAPAAGRPGLNTLSSFRRAASSRGGLTTLSVRPRSLRDMRAALSFRRPARGGSGRADLSTEMTGVVSAAVVVPPSSSYSPDAANGPVLQATIVTKTTAI